jgi:hypothetical protein
MRSFLLKSHLGKKCELTITNRKVQSVLYIPIALVVVWVFITTIKTTPGDYLYYSQSGRELFNGVNIYETGARWGTYAAAVSSLLFGFLPFIVVNILLTLSIPVGAALLSRHLGVKNTHAWLVGSVTLFTAAGR